MGLNSYYIVVPGMSQFATKREHYEVLNDTYYSLNSLRNIEHISKEELLDMCKKVNNYKAGMIKEAYWYLQEFLKNKDFGAYKYYYGIKDYVRLKLENNSDDEIKNKLSILYSDELAEIIDDVKDPDKILRYYEWPQNFNCENCALIDECRQLDLLRVVKNIQGKHQEANINHNTFIF